MVAAPALAASLCTIAVLLPVVLLTGWADELDEAHRRHVDVLLAKPITRERLLSGLAKAVPDRVRPA